MQEVLQRINNIVSSLNDIQKIKDDHSSAMQEVEYKISDILHLIELNDIPDSACKKVIAELKKLRILRRDLKNQYELLKTFDTHKEKLLKDNARFMFNAEIGKMEKRLHSAYNNRVYTEEELNNFIKPTRGRPKKEEPICCLENVKQQKTDNDSQSNTTESNANNES